MPERNSFQGKSFKNIIEVENPEGWDEIYAGHTFHQATWYFPSRTVRERRFKLIHNLAHPLPNPAARTYHPSWQAAVARGLTTYVERSMAATVCPPEFELYDVQADPDEVHNLAGDPKYREELRIVDRCG